VIEFDHSACIGRELTRVDLALVTGRPYIQEAPLFLTSSMLKKERGGSGFTASGVDRERQM
jgi:hypothetical protein